MEAMESRRLDTSYDKLVTHEPADEDSLGMDPNKQKVSMSMVRTTPLVYQQRALIIALATLATLLLAVDIGLGVYYAQLSSATWTVQDVNIEIAKTKASYTVQSNQRDEAKRRLNAVLNRKKMKNWEYEHLTKRIKDYEKRADQTQTEIQGLKAHLLLLKEGCRHCQPGWIYMRSSCFFFSFSSGNSPTGWKDAQSYCQRTGATLVVVDSRDKQMAINDVISHTQPRPELGIWIGLDDLEEEGIWRWPDGTRVVNGFWNDGEPNNHGQENCGEIVTKIENPFKSWNDLPCRNARNWICEMNPTLI